MKENIKILKDIMQKGIPILFLGAGFSYGSSNREGELPTGKKLTEDIFNYFIKIIIFVNEFSENKFIYEDILYKNSRENFLRYSFRYYLNVLVHGDAFFGA